jgi:DNA invertase Pin-like site-specific DNA recombinase
MNATKAKRAAIYLRVSTDRQTVENQRLALTETATKRGWSVVQEYSDKGISGTKDRAERPGLDAMLDDARAKAFDVVMIWALDRLGRTMKIVLATAGELHAAGCELYAERQNIDTTSANGRFTFHIFAAIAELERDTIVERINAGLKRARANGVKLGRPGADPDKLAKAERMLRRGEGILKTAKLIGLGSGTVQKLAKEIRGV